MIEVKPEHYLHNSTESHHMLSLCQRSFWSCLIHFLGTTSTAYLLQSLAITEQYPYLLPDSSLIAMVIFPDCFLIAITIAEEQFFHIHEEDCSHIQRQKHFHQLKCHMIQLGGENYGYRSLYYNFYI